MPVRPRDEFQSRGQRWASSRDVSSRDERGISVRDPNHPASRGGGAFAALHVYGDRFREQPPSAVDQYFIDLGRNFEPNVKEILGDLWFGTIGPMFMSERDWNLLPPELQEQLGYDPETGTTESFRQKAALGRELAAHSIPGLPYALQGDRSFEEAYPTMHAAGQALQSIVMDPLTYVKEQPAEVALELALGGAGAVSRVSRLSRMRGNVRLRGDVIPEGSPLEQLAVGENIFSRTVRQVQDRFRSPVDLGQGFGVGDGLVAVPAHTFIGGESGPLSNLQNLSVRGALGFRNRPVTGIRAIDYETDIALLEVEGRRGRLPLADDLTLGTEHTVSDLSGFVGQIEADVYRSIQTGHGVGTTSYIGQAGESGAALRDPSGEVVGMYGGVFERHHLQDQGIVIPGSEISRVMRSSEGAASVPFSSLDPYSEWDRLMSGAVHLRAGRGGVGIGHSTLSGADSPFLPTGLSTVLHGSRYRVTDPLNIEWMDPRSVGETPTGRTGGLALYSDDVRRMILDIVNPRISLDYRAQLIGQMEDFITLDRIPEAFRQENYAGVIGVPSSPDRLAQRGYNLADIIGRKFASELDIPFLEGAVFRSRNTARSSAFVGDQGARVENLSGAFEVRNPTFIAGQRFLTSDDILTTGATFDELRRTLLASGAQSVDSLAFSTTLPGLKLDPKLSQFLDVEGGSGSGDFGLTALQQSAAAHREGYGFFDAVPGSGKTHTLIERAHQLVSEGVQPSEILNITFSRAGARELSERLSPTGEFPARTMHSLAYEVVRDYYGADAPKIIPELNIDRFKSIVKDRGVPGLELDRRRSEALRLGRDASTPEELETAFELYKGERDIATFGDYLQSATRILEDNPDIRQKYHDEYKYIQLDEFQDFSAEGWNFLRQFGPNITAAGDLNQAIYGFIGATGEVVSDFLDTAQVYPLTENFRSGQNLVEFSDRFIGLNPSRTERPASRSFREGGNIEMVETTGETIFEELASRIEGLDPSSFAILTRTNREIAALEKYFGDAFEHLNVGTIHSAKGREWDNVFLPMDTIPVTFGGGIEKVYSRSRARMTSADVEAERRVAYVGATRARQNLSILGSGDIFQELKSVRLHGNRLRDEGFDYGFTPVDSDEPSLLDLGRFIQDQGLYARATHYLENSDANTSLDWAQTLAISMDLRERGVDLPLRGEESALFPREIYQQYKREIDYQIAPGSSVQESRWEPGMMGVFQHGIYAVQDLELLLKHAYWNPNPRLHMGGPELRLFQGDVLKEGFQVSLPPDAQGFAPPGEFIINPQRMLGMFDFEDIYHLRTGDQFTGQPMELEYELGNYGLQGLRPLDELEQQLKGTRLHGQRIAVTGGRDYRDKKTVFNVLDKLNKQDPITELMHGGARGADTLSRLWAEARDVESRAFYPDWDRYGKAAGPIRNNQILNQSPDALVAFLGGRGTAHMTSAAERRGIPVYHAADILGSQELNLQPTLFGLGGIGLASPAMLGASVSDGQSEGYYRGIPLHLLQSEALDWASGSYQAIGGQDYPSQSFADLFGVPSFTEGLQSEVGNLPGHLIDSYFRGGSDSVVDTLKEYPMDALKRQGFRVAKNYAKDAFKNFFRPESKKVAMSAEKYLGFSPSKFLGSTGGALLGAAALAAGTAWIGEKSLDANYAEVIPTAADHEQAFLDQFRDPSERTQRELEVGDGQTLDVYVQSAVYELLREINIPDELVTAIGRKMKIQIERGLLDAFHAR